MTAGLLPCGLIERVDRVAALALRGDSDYLEFSREAVRVLLGADEGAVTASVVVATALTIAVRETPTALAVVASNFGAGAAALTHECASLPFATTSSQMCAIVARLPLLSRAARLVSLAMAIANFERIVNRGMRDWQQWRVQGVSVWHKRCLAALARTDATLEGRLRRRLKTATIEAPKRYACLPPWPSEGAVLSSFFERVDAEERARRAEHSKE